jgi:transcriptional regulator with XRE-family HTH domain
VNQKKSTSPLTSAQIRAARGLVRWSAEDLAKEARLGLATIRRAEQSERETSLTAANDLAIRRTLEDAGVEFIDENGGGPGVRLRKAAHEKKGK